MRIQGFQIFKKIFPSVNRLGIILMYHRVANLDYDPLCLNVSPKHFEEQIRIIKQYGRLVKMKNMVENLNRVCLGTVDIVITFDDGYADNFYNAKSILEQADVPATFFIITGYIDSQEEFYWDRLKYSILAPETLPQILEITIADKKYRWKIAPSGSCQSVEYAQSKTCIPSNDITLSRSGLYCVLIQILGPLSIEQRQGALKHLLRWSNQALTVRTDCLPMTFDDLVSLASCPLFEIGAHTVNHPSLASLPIQKQGEEINQSKTDLENRLNKSIVSFSYPHGNYSKETVKFVKSLKFQNACTAVSNPVMRNTNPYLLPRFSVKDWNGDEFERNLRNWLT